MYVCMYVCSRGSALHSVIVSVVAAETTGCITHEEYMHTGKHILYYTLKNTCIQEYMHTYMHTGIHTL